MNLDSLKHTDTNTAIITVSGKFAWTVIGARDVDTIGGDVAVMRSIGTFIYV